MNDSLQDAAERYVLDSLDPAELAGFEAELGRNPELRAWVRTTQDCLLRAVVQDLGDTASPAPDVLGRIHAIVAADSARPEVTEPIAFPTPRPAARRQRTWVGMVWPAAAAILLGVNLYLVFGRETVPAPATVASLPQTPNLASTARPAARETLTQAPTTPGIAPAAQPPAIVALEQERDILRQESTALRAEVQQRTVALEQQSDRIQRMAQEHAVAQKQIVAWKQAYNTLAKQAAPLLNPPNGADVLTVVTLQPTASQGNARETTPEYTADYQEIPAATPEAPRMPKAKATWSRGKGSGTLEVSLPPPPANKVYVAFAYDAMNTYNVGAIPLGSENASNLSLSMPTSVRTASFNPQGFIISLESNAQASLPGNTIVLSGSTIPTE